MARRVVLLLAIMFAFSAAVAAIAPRPELEDDPTPRTVPSAPGGDVTAAVRGTLPRDRVVRARVGDIVELTVTADEPDSASIEALGLIDAAAPGAPARFSFAVDRPGRFDVRLTLSGQRAGRIVVRPA